MDSRFHVAYKAEDRSYFAILKKEIHALALSAGFNKSKVGEIDIIVAELVSNLVKHGGGGSLFVKLMMENGLQGIEIIAVDNGKGMTDVTRMVTDGVSTKNTLGHGLGSMKRLANFFQVYSQKDWGTIILIRVYEEELQHLKSINKVEIRSLVVPKAGEKDCGDGFCFVINNEEVRIFLGDGLGHGTEAAAAVIKASEAFLECTKSDPVEIIRYLNDAVKKTRGLVGTVAIFNFDSLKWKICGIGNIATKIIGPSFSKGYMAYNGIIGLNLPRTLNVQEIEHEKGQFLLMCSDGLKSRWETLKFPGINRFDLSILTAALIKDFARNTDDMSAAACKLNI